MSNSILGVNVEIAQQIYFFKVKSCLGLLSYFQNFSLKKLVLNTDSLQLAYIFRMQITLFAGIDSNFNLKCTFKMCAILIASFEIISVKLRCKFNNFSIVTSICPKCYCTQLSCPKKIVEKFSLSELKIEEVKFSTQSSTKIFSISVFNVGSCLARRLTFRPCVILDLQQLGCL